MGGNIVGSITDQDIEQELYPKMKEYWHTDREKYTVFKEAVGLLFDWSLRGLLPWWEYNDYNFDLFSSDDEDEYDEDDPNYSLLWPTSKFTNSYEDFNRRKKDLDLLSGKEIHTLDPVLRRYLIELQNDSSLTLDFKYPK
jgi:hypothetical protein